mmetsp:Transcript_125434/g.222275  ORF Transcript_125434/g.222275 Transcript_125434/m.222275 type:complete len:1302 (-) Transcript_125434:22-3927(-)
MFSTSGRNSSPKGKRAPLNTRTQENSAARSTTSQRGAVGIADGLRTPRAGKRVTSPLPGGHSSARARAADAAAASKDSDELPQSQGIPSRKPAVPKAARRNSKSMMSKEPLETKASPRMNTRSLLGKTSVESYSTTTGPASNQSDISTSVSPRGKRSSVPQNAERLFSNQKGVESTDESEDSYGPQRTRESIPTLGELPIRSSREDGVPHAQPWAVNHQEAGVPQARASVQESPMAMLRGSVQESPVTMTPRGSVQESPRMTPRGSVQDGAAVSPRGSLLSGSAARASLKPKDDGRIQVCIRCRPLNSKEIAEASKFIWDFRPQHVVELDDDERTPTGKTWAFDNTFGPDVDTKGVFETQCRPIVQSALDGYNGTIFAYGQTSSGKTHTLMGNPETSPGVSILSVDEIFNFISLNSHVEYDTFASYIEIYNESLTDLLQRDARKGKNLKIIEDKTLGPTVKDLKELPVLNRQHCLDLILDGEKRRTYATTKMNESSSRSHTVFRLRVEARSGGAKQKEQCQENMSRVANEFMAMQNQLTADHASLYLVDQTTNELFIQAGEITLRLPMSQGIAGAVATTGETINIADAYKDSRFDSSIDKKTGYRTKSILCMPIYGTDEQVVGVVQFINKMQGGSEGFHSNDELLVAGLTQRLGPLISAAQGSATMSLRSQLNLVDLAGSERASKSGATGNVLKQAGFINQSLHTLGACIAILADGKKQHVPFRDSKLTQLLSSSLGGNAKTCLICAMNPASSNRSETVSTLQFASRAKKIVNQLHRNCQRDQGELVEAYEAEIAKLKAQIQQRNTTRSSFISPDQEASYMLQSNWTSGDDSGSYTEEFVQKLNKFETTVAEAQMLANKPVTGKGTRICLRARVANERGKRDDLELVVRANCDLEVKSENVNTWAQWISEEEFDARLEWLRKQDAHDMLTSDATNGNHAWDYAGSAIGMGILLPWQGSSPVRSDGWRTQNLPGSIQGPLGSASTPAGDVTPTAVNSLMTKISHAWEGDGSGGNVQVGTVVANLDALDLLATQLGAITLGDEGELPCSSDAAIHHPDVSESVYSQPRSIIQPEEYMRTVPRDEYIRTVSPSKGRSTVSPVRAARSASPGSRHASPVPVPARNMHSVTCPASPRMGSPARVLNPPLIAGRLGSPDRSRYSSPPCLFSPPMPVVMVPRPDSPGRMSSPARLASPHRHVVPPGIGTPRGHSLEAAVRRPMSSERAVSPSGRTSPPALPSPPASPLVTSVVPQGALQQQPPAYIVAYSDSKLQGIFRNLQESPATMRRNLYVRVPLGSKVVTRATL